MCRRQRVLRSPRRNVHISFELAHPSGRHVLQLASRGCGRHRFWLSSGFCGWLCQLVGMAGDLSALKVAELKNRLRELNLPVSGKKAELVQRLRDAGPTGGPVDAGTILFADGPSSSQASSKGGESRKGGGGGEDDDEPFVMNNPLLEKVLIVVFLAEVRRCDGVGGRGAVITVTPLTA